jgi:hypothetical protein
MCCRLGNKLQEYNVTLPTVTIEYEGLTAKTDATKGSAGITTVGNLPLKVGAARDNKYSLLITDACQHVITLDPVQAHGSAAAPAC